MIIIEVNGRETGIFESRLTTIILLFSYHAD